MQWKCLCVCLLPLSIVLLSGCSSHRGMVSQQYAYLADGDANPQTKRIYHVLPRYERLVGASWPTIAYNKAIKPGDSSEQLPAIRQRLLLLGDLSSSANDKNSRYDARMVDAVKRYQARHGLDATGIIGRQTIASLNIKPCARLSQLVDSMQRWAKLPSSDSGQYIQVNVPSYQLQVMDKGVPELSMRVVVGQPRWPTPELQSAIQTVVVNPAWNVPRNITEREIVHHMVKNPDYLKENDLVVYKDWKKNTTIDPTLIDWQEYAGEKDLPYLIAQDPGDKNALGAVKFIFENSHDVYLHDTQAKSLFAKTQRDFSHGCIRLAEPDVLYQYLTKTNPNLESERAKQAIESGKTKYLALQKPVPIYLTYMTAWVTKNGTVEFRKDIYKKTTTNVCSMPI